MHSFSDATFLLIKLLYKSIIRLMSALICAASVSSSSSSTPQNRDRPPRSIIETSFFTFLTLLMKHWHGS